MMRRLLFIALLLATSGVVQAQSDWTVNPSAFEHSMSMVVEVSGSSLQADKLAAFVDDAVRGVAQPTTVGERTLYFLTVYANVQQETVRFRFFDAASDTVIDLTDTVSFVTNGVIGTVSEPYVLEIDHTTPPPDQWQVNPAAFSANMSVVADVTMDVAEGDRLAAIVGTSVRGVAEPVMVAGAWRFFLTIHGNTTGSSISYAYHDASTDAVHDMNESDAFQENAVLGSIASPRKLTTGSTSSAGGEGVPDWSVNPAGFQFSMSIVARPDGDITADDLLAVFSGTEVRGVVGPTAVGASHLFFLTAYSNTTGGPLSARLYRSSTDAIDELTPDLDFQPDGVLGTVAAPVELESGGGASDDNVFTDVDLWTVDASGFERTMSVIAAFRVDGTLVAAGTDRLVAFVGNEVRGAAEGTLVGDRLLFFLTAYANSEGEELSFRGFDSVAGEVRILDESLDFVSNGVEGTVASPVVMDAVWPQACVPDVAVEGADVQTVSSGYPIVLTVATGLPSCATAQPAIAVLWELVSGPALVLDGADRESIEIPAASLTPGATYIFRVTAITTGNVERVSEALVTVTVQRAPLQVVIAGGDRTVGDGRAFTLDASSSKDPDDDSALTGFSWTCEASDSGQPCLQGSLAAAATVTVSAGALAPGEYRFVVTGTKDTRSATDDVLITVEEGLPPEVGIASPAIGVPFNPSERLVLEGSAQTDVPGDVSWSWSVPGLDLFDAAVSGTGPMDQTLEIEPDVLAEGTTYTFQLTAEDAEGRTGSAQVEIETSSSPAGGTLSVSPVEGTAFSTVFEINAQGWASDDGALTYQYLVRRTDGALIPLTDRVSRTTVQVVLPAGDPLDNDLLTVVVRVINALGQTVVTDVPVTVRPTPPIQNGVLTTNAPEGEESDEGTPRIELDGDLPVDGSLQLDGLDLDLNGNNLVLGPNATLDESGGSVMGEGTVRTDRTMNAPAEQNIGGIGLGLTSSSNLGTTRIERRHGPVTLPDGSSSIRRRFSIEPATQPSDGITITIRFTAADLVGHDPATLTCFVFDETAGAWTTEGVSVVARTATSVTCQATHLSEWTLGPEGGDVPLTLNARVFLEGPLDAGGATMTSGLGASIPLTQPYGAASFAGTPMAYSGTETVALVPENAVDWILVELRDAGAAVAQQAAFVLDDGRVVRTDGTGRLRFDGVPAGSYTVVVRHRNHLPVASPALVALSKVQGTTGAPFDIAFSDALLAGDADGDGEVQNDDKNEAWFATLGQSGYLPGDFNLDGQVTTTDRDLLWRRNVGRGALPELK